MNILVNTRLLLHGKMEGIGFYTHQLMQILVKKHPEHTFYFLFDRPFHQDFVYASNVVPLVYGPPARHPFLYLIWFEITIPRIVTKYKIDLFFSPDHFMSLRAKVPTVLAVHDLNFIHHPEHFPFIESRYYRYFVPKFVHKAKRIIAVSEYTKKDIIQTFSVNAEKIDVVYNAPNLPYIQFSEEEKEKIRKKYTGGKPFFTYIGSLNRRKNTARMLQAFDKFAEKYPNEACFVLVGKPMWKDKALDEVYSKLKHKDKIIFTGYLPSEEVSKILASSVALVFVSLFEGFGVPIIEAMSLGVPVITSSTSSMPEVAEDAAILVDPHSIDDIAQAMEKIYFDKTLRNTLINYGQIRKKHFDWNTSAERVWNTFMQALK
ncbi:MAG: glycosyltransferase family 4 protein [Bacteroidales bacterium]|nr:glycosyltransferase family 4 protein [Bacteroidales bacterium]